MDVIRCHPIWGDELLAQLGHLEGIRRWVADTTSALTAAAIPTASTARAPELETWSADGTGSAASRSG